MPTLIDDGEAFYDSHAIVTYLVSKYAANDALYPADLVLRAKIDQRLYFDAGVLTPQLKCLVAPILFAQALELDPDTVRQTHRIYEQIEAYLVRRFMVGNSMTVADITCAATMFTLEHLVPVEADLYPRIKLWLTFMEQVAHHDEVHGSGAKMLAIGLNKYIELNLRRTLDLAPPKKVGSYRARVQHQCDRHV